MSKLKKLLVGFLALVLTITMLPVQATVTAYADTTTTTSTIDTTKKGSLTIHKYEYNGNNGSVGTGSESDSVPSDAVGLNDVKFQVTLVAKIDDCYGPDGELITLDKALEITKKNSESSDFSNIGDWQYVTTASKTIEVDGEEVEVKGIATLDDLPLGIYLVQEVSAPAQITGKTADFLVSIPMTNSISQDPVNDPPSSDQWIYDVHVYPKNSSTYASVTLLKKGQVGNTDAGALVGATFVLQKKGTDGKWTTIEVNNKNEAIGKDGVLTTDSYGKIFASNLAPGEYRFVEIGVPNESGYIMDGATTYEFEIASEDATDKNEDGTPVYSKGAVLIGGQAVDTTQNPIIAINHKPDVEKQVQTADGWANAYDYSVGDTVPYRIKVDVPENVASLKDFTITDTMQAQTYESGTLRIFSNEALTDEILLDDDDREYRVEEVSTSGWKIAFNSTKDDGSYTSLLEEYKGSSIYIYFEAKLTSDAVTTVEGNDNTVSLEYSNKIIPTEDDGNPNTPEDPKDPEKDVISDQATVYTFKIEVEKVDASNISKKLEGVTFDVYQKVSGNVSDLPVNGLPEGTYKKVGTLTTDAKGTASSNGLENGTYYLVETKTNNGYNLLKAPVEVEIKISYTVKTTTDKKTEDGVTTITTTIKETTFTNEANNDDATFSAVGNYKTVIANSTGFTLPTTGGMGTVIFVIVGVSMMLAAVLLLLMSKKKEAK